MFKKDKIWGEERRGEETRKDKRKRKERRKKGGVKKKRERKGKKIFGDYDRGRRADGWRFQ